MSILISIEKLLSGKYVEGSRMEFKQSWNPKMVMRSLCAFANDFENVGSGYVVIGVEEKEGRAVRPVKGIDPSVFEKIQRELIGYCNLINPPYVPRVSLEAIDGRQYNYRIRQFSSTKPAVFDTNEPNRSYFVVEIRVHPEFEEDTLVLNEGASDPKTDPNQNVIKGLSQRQMALVVLLNENCRMTRNELAAALKVGRTSIAADLKVLRERGIIERVGGAKGYWKINKKNYEN